MNFLRSLRLQFSPPKMKDPEFGDLRWMYISNHPERSYWECEWKFPKTDSIVNISLPGDQTGPNEDGRQFYLSLVPQFEELVERVRPKLEEVFREWLERPLPSDVFTAVKLAGFDCEEDPAVPGIWSISFETTGEKWLGITIPIVGEEPQTAVVDT